MEEITEPQMNRYRQMDWPYYSDRIFGTTNLLAYVIFNI